MLRSAAILVTSALMAVSIAGPATARPAADPLTARTANRADDPADAFSSDELAIQEARGWRDEQLAAYLASESALDVISERVSLEYPESFVGSALAEDPLDPPTLFVKGAAQADIRALAAELGVTLVEHQPKSRDEIDADLAVVQAALADAGFDQFVVSADITDEGAIEAVVGLPPDASLDAVGDRLRSAIDVSLATVDVPVVESQGAFGGMKLQDDGVFMCTSGWTVRRIADGLRGVTAAGHCPPGDNQINHPGHGVHPTFFQQEHIGQWGDVEWSTTNELEADDFYADEFNSIRDVSAVEPRGNISVNESICFYGRSSNHRDCSLEVENPDVFCGFPQQKFVQMNGSVTLGGDSGGGWSFNNTAYGGHYGLCFGKSSFSVADLFDEALGVTVALT
jgi:streptogrisin C